MTRRKHGLKKMQKEAVKRWLSKMSSSGPVTVRLPPDAVAVDSLGGLLFTEAACAHESRTNGPREWTGSRRFWTSTCSKCGSAIQCWSEID